MEQLTRKQSCRHQTYDGSRSAHRGGRALHVRQSRLVTVAERKKCRAKLEEMWRPNILALVFRYDRSRSHLALMSDLARGQDRHSGRVVLLFPWSWNVLATWPIQSVLTESPFLCARERTKGIVTNCADTARLVGRSHCCRFPISRRSMEPSLANLFVSHDVLLRRVSLRENLDSCDQSNLTSESLFFITKMGLTMHGAKTSSNVKEKMAQFMRKRAAEKTGKPFLHSWNCPLLRSSKLPIFAR